MRKPWIWKIFKDSLKPRAIRISDDMGDDALDMIF